jgi:Domain of unknown function (DUF6919)
LSAPANFERGAHRLCSAIDANRELAPLLPSHDGERARDAWRRARSFDELCRLGEAFVGGACAFFPGWGWRELDDESAHIASVLATFHRAGFMTVASQPGRAFFDENGRAIQQRAFVCGFASQPQLSIALFRRGDGGGTRTPVSLHGGVPAAFAGDSAFEAELECFAEHVSPAAIAELERATYVSAFDREWGRDSTLWPAIESALSSE